MGFLGLSVLFLLGGMMAPPHNLVVFARMTMKFGEVMELDVLYTNGNKNCCD